MLPYLETTPQFPTSFCDQLKIIGHRSLLNMLRNPLSTGGQIGIAIFFSVLVGGMLSCHYGGDCFVYMYADFLLIVHVDGVYDDDDNHRYLLPC